MHVVNHIRAAVWQLEPRAAAPETTYAGATVVPLRPAAPSLVLVQHWIFAPAASTRTASDASPRSAPRGAAPYLHPVR